MPASSQCVRLGDPCAHRRPVLYCLWCVLMHVLLCRWNNPCPLPSCESLNESRALLQHVRGYRWRLSRGVATKSVPCLIARHLVATETPKHRRAARCRHGAGFAVSLGRHQATVLDGHDLLSFDPLGSSITCPVCRFRPTSRP